MKGREIVALWEKACRDVDEIHGNPGGEIGDRLRGKGYTISYDGASVCDFRIRGKCLYLYADCCEGPWHVTGWVTVGKGDRNSCRVGDIEADKEYGVEDDVSCAELFSSGRLKAKSFAVLLKGGRSIEKIGEYTDFLKADELARAECQRQIDICNKDRDWRHYTAGSVVDDALRAWERFELRHYEYYNYQGHRYWVVVEPVDYKIDEGDQDGK